MCDPHKNAILIVSNYFDALKIRLTDFDYFHFFDSLELRVVSQLFHSFPSALQITSWKLYGHAQLIVWRVAY